MRTFGPDLALFVVGALLFSGATYGLIASGGLSGALDDSNLGLYKVSWKSNEATSDVGRYTEGQQPQMMMSNITGQNLAKVVFTFECRDPSPAASANPYRFSVKFEELPAGLTAPEDVTNQACTGTVEREIVIRTDAPAESHVNAENAEGANAEAAKLADTTTGNGEYHLTVSGARTQAFPGPISGTAGGANVTVKVKIVNYASTVEAVNAPLK